MQHACGMILSARRDKEDAQQDPEARVLVGVLESVGRSDQSEIFPGSYRRVRGYRLYRRFF
jgi:hypothetical protein